MKYVAVFCGSREGVNPLFKQTAKELGMNLANSKLGLVYGGSSMGIMGAVADGVLECGGEVVGVIPTILSDKEKSHQKVTEMKIVNSMHERKAQLYDIADGYIILPGGIGTLDEFFEIFTWHYIGEHTKPIGILNVDHYFDPLIHLIDHMVEQDFLVKKTRDIIYSVEHPNELISYIKGKIKLADES